VLSWWVSGQIRSAEPAKLDIGARRISELVISCSPLKY
jgi:hypothetical protein